MVKYEVSSRPRFPIPFDPRRENKKEEQEEGDFELLCGAGGRISEKMGFVAAKKTLHFAIASKAGFPT